MDVVIIGNNKYKITNDNHTWELYALSFNNKVGFGWERSKLKNEIEWYFFSNHMNGHYCVHIKDENDIDMVCLRGRIREKGYIWK